MTLQHYLIYISTLLGILLPIGVVLLFYKKKKDVRDPVKVIESLNIKPEVKKIFIEEVNGDIARFPSQKWFLDYLKGKRSLTYAVFYWFLALRILINIFLTCLVFITVSIFSPANTLHAMMALDGKYHDLPLGFRLLLLTVTVLQVIYAIVEWIVIWRCSKNVRSKNSEWYGKSFVIFLILRFLALSF